MEQRIYDAVARNPVIASVKDMAGVEKCIASSDVQVVFVLFGDICSISRIVARLKENGKVVMVHVDLITGLAGKEVSVDFLHSGTEADGIISTRPNLIRRARELHMCNVLRLFVIDSMALASIKNLETVRPDFIEVLPGVMPKTIRKVCAMTSIPILAGGLIADKEDVMGALDAGAMAISTTNPGVWSM